MIQRTNRSTTIDPSTRAFILRKVRQLVGRFGFTRSDREDLEQELLLRLLDRLHLFDPNQGTNAAFDVMVIERSVANIVRERKAAKRDFRRVTSLNVIIEELGDEGTSEMVDTIGQRELDARIGRTSRSQEELTQLITDVAEVIGRLPEELRVLAEQLKSTSKAGIARDRGIPRTTLYGDIGKLRERFEDANLKDYV
jgi:RNA polymerase sigma-70 factor (ECF subfamily)